MARRRAAELLDSVGLADRAAHLPSALSGGQRQRVAIARALVNEPLVVLADEPTGNLDSAATLDVLRLFKQLRTGGQTFVIVTHDERVAATADRLISMRDGAFVDQTRLTGGTTGRLGRTWPGWRADGMGRAFCLAVWRAKDLRRHLSEAVLLFLVIAAAAATLTLGLVLARRDQQPLQHDPGSDQAGPDAVANLSPNFSTTARSVPTPTPPTSAALQRAPGVVGTQRARTR